MSSSSARRSVDHSDANVDTLKRQQIPALIADNQMRQRDERFNDQGKHRAKEDPLYDKQATGKTKVIKRFTPQDFRFRSDNTATCPAGKTLKSTGKRHTTAAGLRYQLYAADTADCQICTMRGQCLREPSSQRGRQVTRFEQKAKTRRNPASA